MSKKLVPERPAGTRGRRRVRTSTFVRRRERGRGGGNGAVCVGNTKTLNGGGAAVIGVV